MIFDLSPDNPSCSDFSAYAEWLLQGGLSAQTVRNHFSAIKALYIWVGNQKAVDILNSPPWMMSIKGMINTVRPNRSVRSAMTPDDLIAMIHASTSSDYLTSLLVALTFGFFWYLRISNLAPPKASTFDPTRHTTFRDITEHEQGLAFSMKWSKSRQSTRNSVMIPLPDLGSSILCPVRAWRIYKRMLGYAKVNTDASTPPAHPP